MASTSFLEWFPAFLRSELAPYPGRAAAVARITIAVVITFILVTTFRIPGSALTLYMVFTITRDSPSAAVRSALVSILAITVGLAVSLFGVWLCIDSPLLHFLYTLFEFLILFWLVRVMVQPSAAINMGLAVYNTAIVWTLPFPAERHLETTLWFWLSMSLGTVVAAVVEVFLVRVDPIAVLLTGIDDRLCAVEALLTQYAKGPQAVSPSAEAKRVVSLATVGTGGLRRQLRSAENGHAHLRQYLAELNSVIAMAGRLVDLSANASILSHIPSESDRVRLSRLTDELGRIRHSIRNRDQPAHVPLQSDETLTQFPLLPEMEKTVSAIPQAFSAGEDGHAAVPSDIDEEPKTRWLVADAFTNPDYLRFALKGCLAAAICFVIYTGVDWPGIGTSVITCLITALSTLGASKQKQFLRISGAALGGVVAIFSIVFLLPHMDRITNVALLIAAVSAACGWIATSSPRLSYFGLQTGLAFFLTTLQDYATPTLLAPARDRFVGVLLGLTVMWSVFDKLWPVRATDEMRASLRGNIRLLAELTRVLDDVEGDRAKAIPQIRRLRELINTGFQNVQAHSGTVRFEFGADRRNHLAIREETLQIEEKLRTAFLLELAILQYRVQLNTHDIPDDVLRAQIQFNAIASGRLNLLADALPHTSPSDLEAAENMLDSTLRSWADHSADAAMSARAEGILSLSRQLVTVLDELPH